MKKRYKRKRSGWMRRTSRIYLDKTVNKSKRDKLKNFLVLYQLVVTTNLSYGSFFYKMRNYEYPLSVSGFQEERI